MGTFVQRFAIFNIRLCLAGPRYKRDWRDGNSFVDDRNTKLFFNILTDLNKVAGFSHDFVVNPLICFFGIRISTIQKGNSHCDTAHVEFVAQKHINSFLNFNRGKEHSILRHI